MRVRRLKTLPPAPRSGLGISMVTPWGSRGTSLVPALAKLLHSDGLQCCQVLVHDVLNSVESDAEIAVGGNVAEAADALPEYLGAPGTQLRGQQPVRAGSSIAVIVSRMYRRRRMSASALRSEEH